MSQEFRVYNYINFNNIFYDEELQALNIILNLMLLY